MQYKENPKTKGSGIICAIPQEGECPQKCSDCFFQSGRSFLEPLDENLPNMPDIRDTELYNRVVRVNDGNDSNHQKALVIGRTKGYSMKFYNTSIPKLGDFDAPVILTINPAKMTDVNWHKLEEIPDNLMGVRIRANLWNIETVIRPAVRYYTKLKIPVFLTFMAYYDITIPLVYRDKYIYKKRTLNSYWVIKTYIWKQMMDMFWRNDYVYSCSKIEGEKASRSCSRCGNCIREFFVTKERMLKGDGIRL